MANFDPANRELCPDGGCIGVIGPDGRCKECGTVSPSATTHSRYRGMELGDAEDDMDDPSVLSSSKDDRALCPDDMCIGLIGPDGRCKECGRAADGSAPEAEAEADGDAEFDDRRLCPDELCIGLIGPDGRCKECGTPANSGGS